MRKRRGYTSERRFVRVLVKMTKKFGPMGWGGSDPLGYAPGYTMTWRDIPGRGVFRNRARGGQPLFFGQSSVVRGLFSDSVLYLM